MEEGAGEDVEEEVECEGGVRWWGGRGWGDVVVVIVAGGWGGHAVGRCYWEGGGKQRWGSFAGDLPFSDYLSSS